jgi:hypothetical protein
MPDTIIEPAPRHGVSTIANDDRSAPRRPLERRIVARQNKL